MLDLHLRVHTQSQVDLWAWVTVRYNMGSSNGGSVCVHESPGTWLWPTVCLIGVSQRQ